MRSLYISLLLSAAVVVAAGASNGAEARAAEPQPKTIVYIGGVKYYIHTVADGETLYSISKLYGVAADDILAHNPAAADGLRRDSRLTIPVPDGRTVKVKDETSAVKAKEEPSPKKRRKDFDTHIVAAGETLYSISRRYDIPVDTILADNPDVDPSQMSVGTTLDIRKSAMGTASTAQVVERSAVVAGDGYMYYTVQAGETLYSLCRRFGVAESEVRALNDMPDGLKAGAVLRLPSKDVAPAKPDYVEDKKPEMPEYAEQEKNDDKPVREILRAGRRSDYYSRPTDFKALDLRELLRVALMLPMSRNGNVNNHYMDFYRGFLLGAEAVKALGYSMELTLYDTEQNPATVERIIADEFAADAPDLIIGPVYENTLAPVAAYAEKQGIPVVSPLASLTSTDSRVLFQMSPDASRKYDKVETLFNGSRDITLIYGESTDRDFEREVLALLNGKSYSTHKYIYEHQSVIERREKERAARGIDNSSGSGPGDMTVLLRRSKNNLFIILSDNETEVDRILAALASADISLRSRERTVSRFAVLGSSKWNRYVNLDSSIFFRDGLISLSSYSARRDNDKVREFDDRYISDFASMPSPYSYRGYDAAYIFCTAMYGDIEGGILLRRYVPLQTGYMFERTTEEGKVVNTEWMRTDYRDDFTIKVE